MCPPMKINDDITKQIGAGIYRIFRLLGDPWAHPTTPHGRLMVAVLGGLDELEREPIVAWISYWHSNGKVGP